MVFCIVQAIQDGIIVPKVMGRITGLNPAVILLSLSVWGALLGMVGMIIALPCTSILLSYYKMKDDLADEGAFTRIGLAPARPLLAHARKKASEYAALESVIADRLSEISRLEKEKCASVDTCAHPFGELLGALFSYGLSGEDEMITREIGYRLGKFIYAADAAKDYEEDRKKGRFNPYVLSYEGQPLTAENKQTIRTALILECTRMEAAVNLLDFRGSLTLEALIRNIIYNGLLNQIEFLNDAPPEPDPLNAEL